jgi:hypothetical protein
VKLALLVVALAGCGQPSRPTSPDRADSPPPVRCAGQPGSTVIDLSAMDPAIKAQIVIAIARGPQVPAGGGTVAPMPSQLTCDELGRVTTLEVGVARTLRGVESLHNLSVVRIADVVDHDLAPLRGLPLTSLDLGPDEFGRAEGARLEISDFAPIASLVRLTRLRISAARLPDLHVLAPLETLGSLELPGSQVVDLTGLVGLRRLETLDLRDNAILDLGPLVGLVALRTLRLSGNPVSDIGPLAGLRALEAVELARTQLADASPLRDLPALTQVVTCGTPALEGAGRKANRAIFAALRKRRVAVPDIKGCHCC